MKKLNETTKVMLKKFTVSRLDEFADSDGSVEGRATYTTSGGSSKVCRTGL